MITAGGGQHFTKKAFLQVVPGTEDEIAHNPDLEMEEVIVVVEPAAETPAEPPASDGAMETPAVANPQTAAASVEIPPSPVSPAPAVDLEAMTKSELLEHAEAMGVAALSSMTKAQIIAVIQAPKAAA
jgi:hypothetical protein